MSISGVNDQSINPSSNAEEANQADPTRQAGKTQGSSSGFKPPISGLKDMSPEDWQKQLLLLAQNFCTEFKKRNDKLITELKKNRQ